MAQLLLFKQDLRHTVPVQFAVDNEDMRNLITHYNNGVNSVVEELTSRTCRLPIELQTYDEFCEQVPVQQLNKTAQLYQMQKTYIDNCVRFAERLSLELDQQERFLNPFIEPLKLLLDFEKLNCNRVKQCNRVFQLLQIIQEIKKARMQIELRFINLNQLRTSINIA
ncbi:Hypothetical_protein [Hexamita inflata]|uniref:Hypothetical_protein n=1 Tax=Hexamita inflata TaxID=28002 RepID=A0AA86UNE4_9EUKA|nr:Hypothetical protein HINF_LOCUS37666 [Hexamita inflata]CAI9961944.1 Hypothetical protein HINF_LOCUS49589 [Hexamita inflata]